jgi:hypothetical protein
MPLVKFNEFKIKINAYREMEKREGSKLDSREASVIPLYHVCFSLILIQSSSFICFRCFFTYCFVIFFCVAIGDYIDKEGRLMASKSGFDQQNGVVFRSRGRADSGSRVKVDLLLIMKSENINWSQLLVKI